MVFISIYFISSDSVPFASGPNRFFVVVTFILYCTVHLDLFQYFIFFWSTLDASTQHLHHKTEVSSVVTAIAKVEEAPKCWKYCCCKLLSVSGYFALLIIVISMLFVQVLLEMATKLRKYGRV